MQSLYNSFIQLGAFEIKKFLVNFEYFFLILHVLLYVRSVKYEMQVKLSLMGVKKMFFQDYDILRDQFFSFIVVLFGNIEVRLNFLGL